MNAKITASVVLYKTEKRQVENLLSSIEADGAATRFFVIDNSPNDKWRILEKESEKIRYIYNENLGYGASHNIALHLAAEENAQFHAVLNPDIKFVPGTLKKLANFMEENPNASITMPKIFSPDGEVQKLCRLLPNPFDLFVRRFLPNFGVFGKLKKSLDEKNCLAHAYNQVMNPPCLSGCFLFLRLSSLEKFGIEFDERFFMYFEDFDLVRRLHRVSQTLYFPDAEASHQHAQESYKNWKMLKIHLRSAAKYFGKYGWFFDSERKEMNKRILREIGKFAERG